MSAGMHVGCATAPRPVEERAGGGSEREIAVVTFSLQRPEAECPVLGEAAYQETLDRYSGGRDEDGAVFPHHAAVLVAEPENRYDRDAVAVYICDELGTTERVGYLCHEDAVAYAPILRLVSPAIPMCLMTIKGGWDRGPEDRRYHSAVLNMGSPAEMAAEWCFDQHQPRPDHEWAGARVAFLGRSRFAIAGLQLDRAAQAFLATHAGCRPERHVGPDVDLCVVGLPAEAARDQAVLRAARLAGIKALQEGRFWQVLGYELEPWEPGVEGCPPR